MAREHPRYEDTEWPDYEYREYPRIVYPGAKDPKKPYGPDGKRLKGVRVENEAEEAAVMGVSDAAPVALATGTTVDRVKTAEDERQELITEAEQLGVTIDKRWGAAKIQDAIDTFKAEQQSTVL